MSTPRNCPQCGLTNPPGTARCDCGHNFDGPSLPSRNRSDRVTKMAAKPQGYAFGWYIACGSLAMSAMTARATPAEYGLPLDAVLRIWWVVMGVAAAAVRPWSWYVLLSCLALYPVWGGLYMAFVANDWQNRMFVALSAAAMTVVFFAYFYKRRAMFRAKGRWRRLERWCPRLVGPHMHNSDRVPGFAGLSNPSRLYFVAIVAALILLDRLDKIDEVGEGLVLVILLALLLCLFVRRARAVEGS